MKLTLPSASLRKTKVRFDCATKDSDEPPRKKPRLERSRLARCDSTFVSSRGGELRLVLKIEEGKVWESTPSSKKHDFLTESLERPVSLGRIIASHPSLLGEKVKRIIAVYIGYAMLHLEGWLGTAWTSDNVLFHKQASVIPLRPYILTHLRPSPEQPDIYDTRISDDAFDLLHPYPGLVALTTTLIELFMEATMSELATRYNIDHGDENANSRYTVAARVFDFCQNEICGLAATAIDKCLDVYFGSELEEGISHEEDMRKLIYSEIVRNLEDELAHGFGEQLVERLDELAPTMDMRKLGQEIEDVEARLPPLHGTGSVGRVSSRSPATERPYDNHSLAAIGLTSLDYLPRECVLPTAKDTPSDGFGSTFFDDAQTGASSTPT